MLKALLTDIDGTITDSSRRLNTDAIIAIRSLVDNGIEVVLASGNTACFMDALCKMVGTNGTFIAENGGVFRIGYTGTLHIKGDQGICRKALEEVQAYYRARGKELVLFSPTYRFADLAFARTVPLEEVKKFFGTHPVKVTRYRICNPPAITGNRQRNCTRGTGKGNEYGYRLIFLLSGTHSMTSRCSKRPGLE